MLMFGWKELGAVWPTEQAYQVMELLKQNDIRCRMPADDMFFTDPFHLPRPDRRWAIQVRRRDAARAMALLAREDLARATAEPASAAPQRRRAAHRATCRSLRPSGSSSVSVTANP